MLVNFLALQGNKERSYFEGIPRPAGKYSYGLTDTYTSRLFGLAGLTWSLTLSLNHSRVLISNPQIREERRGRNLPERVRALGGGTELRTEASVAIQRVSVTIIGGHHVRGDQVSGTNTEPVISNLETSLQYSLDIMIENRYYLALPGPHQPREVKRSASKGFEVSFEVQTAGRPRNPHIPCLYDTLI